MPPTYHERLRLEGGVLAACGTVGSLVLLATVSQARRGPVSTIAQLLVVAAMLAWLGRRSVRRALAASEPRAAAGIGSGEPTPLWQLPLIVAVLAVGAGLLGGWDAGLRVTGGCALVGLAQSVPLAGLVAADERAASRVHFRLAGSRILRGTRLGWLDRR